MSRLYNHEKFYVRVDFFFQLPHEVGSLLIKCYIIENVTDLMFIDQHSFFNLQITRWVWEVTT